MSAAYPPYPGPVWQREGYASEQDYLDDAYRKLFGTEPPPIPVVTRQAFRVDLPGLTVTGRFRQEVSPHGQGDALHGLGQLDQSLILETSLGVPRVLHRAVRKIFRLPIGHDASPSVECGAPTVGEPAAPDDVLRASSGAAIPGGDR